MISLSSVAILTNRYIDSNVEYMHMHVGTSYTMHDIRTFGTYIDATPLWPWHQQCHGHRGGISRGAKKGGTWTWSPSPNGGGLYFEVGGKIIVKTIVSEPFWAV